MKLFNVLKDKLLASFPIIGPHDDIEAELLLAGKKPLGWITIIDPSFSDIPVSEWHPLAQKDLRNQQLLDEAVRKGTLISKDVVVYRSWAPNALLPFISRHYAQPQYAEDLEKMAAFNRKAFNFEPVPSEEPDFGRLLGYRKRDQFLWNHKRRLPECLMKAIVEFNGTMKESYQAQAVREANKVIQKSEKPTLG